MPRPYALAKKEKQGQGDPLLNCSTYLLLKTPQEGSDEDDDGIGIMTIVISQPIVS